MWDIFMKGPNISHPRRRMIRAILGRNVTTVWSSYLCPNGPYKSGPLFQKPPPRLFSSIDVRIWGGCSLVATITATRCNSSNNIASPCARTSSNKLLCVCLLSGCRGGSAAGLYVLGIFVLARNGLPKLAIAAAFSTTAVICVSSLGVVRWHHTTGRRVLAACHSS